MKRKKELIVVSIITAIIVVLLIVFNHSNRYNKLSINESKWNSIKSTRRESERLFLDDIEFNGYKLTIDKKNNSIYYSVINDSKNKYNPSVRYVTNFQNTKLVILSEEITDEKVRSNYKFKVMIYDEKQYHIYDLICTNHPTLNIRYREEQGNKQKSIPMEIFVFNNLPNTPNRVTVSSGKLRINDSNYTFSLNMLTPGKNRRENRISILNMKPNSEYILTSTNNNEGNLSELQEGANKEPKSHVVELFINNEYMGTYSLGYIQKEIKEGI